MKKYQKTLIASFVLLMVTPLLMSNSPAPWTEPVEYKNYAFSTSRIEALEESHNSRIEVDFTITNSGESLIDLERSYVYFTTLNGIAVNFSSGNIYSIVDYRKNDNYTNRILFPGETIITSLDFSIDSISKYGDISSYIQIDPKISAYDLGTILTVKKEITNREITMASNYIDTLLVIDEVVTAPKETGIGMCYIRVKIGDKWYDNIKHTSIRKNKTIDHYYLINIPSDISDVNEIAEIETYHFRINDYYNHNHFNVYIILFFIIPLIILLAIIAAIVTLVLVLRHRRKKKTSSNNN